MGLDAPQTVFTLHLWFPQAQNPSFLQLRACSQCVTGLRGHPYSQGLGLWYKGWPPPLCLSHLEEV